jgi:hypothetical protein
VYSRVLWCVLFLSVCASADQIVCLVEPAPGTPTTPRLNMPAVGCDFSTPAPVKFQGGHMVSFVLFPNADGPLLVNPTFDSLVFDVNLFLSLDNGPLAPGAGLMHFIGVQPSPGPFLPYNTNLLELDLHTTPGGPLLRLSQSQPSNGITQAQPLPGNVVAFSSFFDVFTELSVDGGQTWIPSTGPSQLVYQNTPEPASASLMLLAVTLWAAGRLYWRRRAIQE